MLRITITSKHRSGSRTRKAPLEANSKRQEYDEVKEAQANRGRDAGHPSPTPSIARLRRHLPEVQALVQPARSSQAPHSQS